jgi:ubiquinone/menaquinone biosynthesis C-methylase UbiE
VYASLLFCNLNEHEKHQTLLNVKRVLKPHGKFFIAEWGKPKTCWAKTGFQLLKWIGGSAHLKILDNGLFPDYLHRHNFLVHEKHFINTAFGTIYFYVAE